MNRILAVISLIVLVGFLGILLYEVPRIDLAIIIGITVLMTAYDFFKPSRRSS